jgi:hypothetical protein
MPRSTYEVLRETVIQEDEYFASATMHAGLLG